MGHVANAPTGREGWTAAITNAWQKSVEHIIEAGRLLQHAKRDLRHGEFEAMIAADLPFSPATARKLMAIGRDARIANRSHANVLPPRVEHLYQLTLLDDATFEAKVKSGVINPDMKRGQIRAPIAEDPGETGDGSAIDIRGRLPTVGANREDSGYWIDEGHVRHTITWPGETYHKLSTRADTNDVSFNEEVLTLIEWALEAYDRWEAEAGDA